MLDIILAAALYFFVFLFPETTYLMSTCIVLSYALSPFILPEQTSIMKGKNGFENLLSLNYTLEENPKQLTVS